MTAATRSARRARTFVASVVLLALFSAGIATAMAAGDGTATASSRDGYWIVHSRNPQTKVNPLLRGERLVAAACDNPVSDASIAVHGTGVAIATFTIADGCTGVPVHLVSYWTPAAGFSLPQTQFSSSGGTFDAGVHDLSVHLPPCAIAGSDGFQVDLLADATAAPETVTEHNLFHVIAAVNGGLPPCHPPTTTDETSTGDVTHPTSTETHSTSTETHPTSTETHPTSTETHPTSTETTTPTHTTTTTTTTHTTTTTPTTTTHTTTTTPTTPTTPTTETTPTVDVSITKLANVTVAFVGDQITYALTVRNSGPATATNVVVVDDLPSEVTFVSSNTSQGTCTGTDPVRCTLGTLAPGASVAITIVVRAASAGTAINGASVSSTEPDTNTANNVAQAIVMIGAFTPPTCPSLSISVSPRGVTVGKAVTVVATVRDQNGSAVAGTKVTLRGGGVNSTKTTNANGRATFHFTPSRTGAVQASIPATSGCTGQLSHVFRVLGAFRPPRPKVTG